MDSNWTNEKISEIASGFMRPRVLITGAELDLFTKLSRNPSTANQLSADNDFDLRGITIILDALTSMELLVKDSNGAYSVEPDVAKALSADSEETVLPMVLHRGRMWKSWSCLTEITQSGRQCAAIDFQERSDEDMEAFIAAMHIAGSKMAHKVAEQVDAGRFRKMLDVGGGSGIYSIAFLHKNPELKATLFDLPKVTQIAGRRFHEAGVSNRTELAPGDYRDDSFPKGFDLVLFSAIIHINSREMNTQLYKKAYDSLLPGGSLIIRDFIMDESRTSPPGGALFAVNMLAATENGNCYTETEVQDDLKTAGFSDIKTLKRGETYMDHLVEAIK